VGVGVGVDVGPGFVVAEGDAATELECADPPPQPLIAKNAVEKTTNKTMR
jgi:hypothetical protein